MKTAAKIKSWINPHKGLEFVGNINYLSERAISNPSDLEL